MFYTSQITYTLIAKIRCSPTHPHPIMMARVLDGNTKFLLMYHIICIKKIKSNLTCILIKMDPILQTTFFRPNIANYILVAQKEYGTTITRNCLIWSCPNTRLGDEWWHGSLGLRPQCLACKQWVGDLNLIWFSYNRLK